MAKVVCPNCGYKNKSGDLICNKCSYYLGEEFNTTSSESQEQEASPAEVLNVNSDHVEQPSVESQGRTIFVREKSSIYRLMPLAISGIVLAIYIYLFFTYTLPPYALIAFLFLIVVVPGFARRLSSPVKFSTTGFIIPQEGEQMSFLYSDITQATVSDPSLGTKTVTLSTERTGGSVSLNFEQMFSLRQFLMQLSRKRIPISIEKRQAQQ